MTTSSHQPLSLAQYDISPERGFLPVTDPLAQLPDEPILNQIGAELPKFLTARQFRSFVQDHQQLMGPVADDWGLDVFRCAMRTLSFSGHAYVWEDPDHPATLLPSSLALPWVAVAQQLGRPPVLSYASYALHNWRRLDPHKPIELGNVVLLQNFLGGLDEEWFVLIHIDIEAKAGPGLVGMLQAHNAARYNKPDDVLEGLQVLAVAQEAMRETLLRMPERCDPYIYYSRVRPYIHGWKNSPSLPQGVVYEGVADYAEQPQQFRGETGSQSSIVPVLDAGLGISHADDPLTQYLMEMRDYMPPRHRAFLAALDAALRLCARSQNDAPRTMDGLLYLCGITRAVSRHSHRVRRAVYLPATPVACQQSYRRRHRRDALYALSEQAPRRNEAIDTRLNLRPALLTPLVLQWNNGARLRTLRVRHVDVCENPANPSTSGFICLRYCWSLSQQWRCRVQRSFSWGR